jgi:hypothetical protein
MNEITVKSKTALYIVISEIFGLEANVLTMGVLMYI